MASEDYYAWRAETEAALSDAIGRGQQLMVDTISAGSNFATINMDRAESARYHCEAVKKEVKLLEVCIRNLETKAARRVPAAPTPVAPGPLERLHGLLHGFHRVAIQLRNRHQGRPTLEINDEYDVQDLFNAMLWIEFDDVRPEEYTPSYAGKSTRMDFLLKSEQVVVEIKYAKQGHGEKEIGTELIADIARYKNHQDCKRLVCFVYDPAHAIRNPAVLERDLSGTRDGLPVEVVVSPKP